MDLFSKMLQLQTQLFLMMGIGYLIRKLQIITTEGRQAMSNLLIYVILPCNIVSSFAVGTEISQDFFLRCGLVLLIAALTQLFAILISKPLFHRFLPAQRSILTYAMICSNSSYIGLPLADALYGSLGVMYTSIFQIPLRFQMWTSGLRLFSGEKITGLQTLKKVFLHPCIISVFVGIALMLLPVQLPDILQQTISSVSKCTTPISMIILGAILADNDIRSTFSVPVLYGAFLRLIAFPIFIYLVLLPFSLDKTILGINVLMASAPAGSITAILADRYNCDPKFASQVVFTTTLLSIVTMPLISLLL